MLHDSLNPAQVVDSEAALEFTKEATKLATSTELENIGQRLEAKSRLFQELLAEASIVELDEENFKRLTGCIFSLRRKAGRVLHDSGLDRLRSELRELLYGDEAIERRFNRFVENVQGLEPAMVVSLGSEALHFVYPERYCLWTHWIWNPGPRTGALPLVIQEGIDLGADSNGEIYDKVGRATAMINAHGHAIGYTRAGRGLFGTDVYLACVYAVYMYTVFRIKLSQEFNRILPELPELVQRVLGVHRFGGSHGS